ncbi:MAG: response regulator [Bacteroidales bacterium]|nr:response regulator [Bacteroidales bacterium]
MNAHKKVLIVDDENDHVTLILRALEKSHEYTTEAAYTLEQALNQVNKFQPDIILADFKLPDGDARSIVTRCAGFIPVIIMTSYGNEALAVEMIKSGALDYLVKTPENFSNIKWFIERTLREWNNIEERKKAEKELHKKNKLLSKVNKEMTGIVEELKKSREKAVESDRLKSAFLANMSHEIRTPMNGILGFANLLSEKDITEEERINYIEIINNCGNQLLVILNDLIDIAKIEANQLSINIQPVEIHDLLSEIHNLFAAKINPEIVFSCETVLKDKCDTIITDPTRLRQVLINLVSNAIKFTKIGNITLGYRHKKEFLEFYVSDTGIGISHEQKETIFQRFMQADVSTTRMFGGTGLGLAISKALVELLGGHIWVESTPGQGSCFYFTIPYHPSPDEKSGLMLPDDKVVNYRLPSTGSGS